MGQFCTKRIQKSLVKCLINRAWHICSCLDGFYKEVDYIKHILVNNGYPQNFIQTLVRKFVQLKSSSDVKQTVLGPEKKQIYLNLPFCGSNSSKIGKQLKLIVGKIAPWTKLNLIFKPVNKLKSLSRIKSSYKLLSHSKVVYRINCLDCEEFYVGMTERILQKTY